MSDDERAALRTSIDHIGSHGPERSKMSTRTPTTRRPREVDMILACATRQHCWSGGGCPYAGSCSGGGVEARNVRALIDYLEDLELAVKAADRGELADRG